MSVSVEELYQFHKEEENFWNIHFPLQDLLPELEFTDIQKNGNLEQYTASRGDDFIILKKESSKWSYSFGTKIPGEGRDQLIERESGDLVDLFKHVYVPMFMHEGLIKEISQPNRVDQNIQWYKDAMRIEARNNIRKMVITQEENGDSFFRKDPYITRELRERFYAPRIELYKAVKEHEANLVEGLSLRFGEKPYAPTIEEALAQIERVREEIAAELNKVSSKYKLSANAAEDIMATAERHAIPLMWQRDFNGRDDFEQGIYDQPKTVRNDLSF